MNNTIKASDFLGSNNSYLLPGIYSNVKLIDINYERGSYVDLTYETTENTKRYMPDSVESMAPGIRERKRIFYPDPNKVFPFDDETKEDAYNRSKVEFMRSLSTTAKYLMPKEEFQTISAETYDQLVEKLVQAIRTNLDNGLFNIKVRLDKNLQYSEIPGRGTAWFEAATGNPDDMPTIKFSSWELNNRITNNKVNLSDLLD